MNPMPDARATNDIEELKRGLQRLADTVAKVGVRPQIRDAALDLISAIEYADESLTKSCLNSLAAAAAELASNMIAKELNASTGVKKGFKEAWKEYIDGKAYEIEIFDAVRDKIETIIDERIAAMSTVRKLVESLEKVDHHVENAQAITDGIRDLRAFREEMLKGWPSRKRPSPIDKAAIAKVARRHRSRREGDG